MFGRGSRSCFRKRRVAANPTEHVKPTASRPSRTGTSTRASQGGFSYGAGGGDARDRAVRGTVTSRR